MSAAMANAAISTSCGRSAAISMACGRDQSGSYADMITSCHRPPRPRPALRHRSRQDGTGNRLAPNHGARSRPRSDHILVRRNAAWWQAKLAGGYRAERLGVAAIP